MKKASNFLMLITACLVGSTTAIAAPPVAGVGQAAGSTSTALTVQETLTAVKFLGQGNAGVSKIVSQFGERGSIFMINGIRLQQSIEAGNMTVAQLEEFVKSNQLTSNTLMGAVAELDKGALVTTKALASTSSMASYTTKLRAQQAAVSSEAKAAAAVKLFTDAEALAAYRSADLSSIKRIHNRQTQLVDLVNAKNNEGAAYEMKLIGRVLLAAKDACVGVDLANCQEIVMDSTRKWYATMFLDVLKANKADTLNGVEFNMDLLLTKLGHPSEESIILGWSQMMTDALKVGAPTYLASRPVVKKCVTGQERANAGQAQYTLAP